jgi:hypothetical protein
MSLSDRIKESTEALTETSLNIVQDINTSLDGIEAKVTTFDDFKKIAEETNQTHCETCDDMTYVKETVERSLDVLSDINKTVNEMDQAFDKIETDEKPFEQLNEAVKAVNRLISGYKELESKLEAKTRELDELKRKIEVPITSGRVNTFVELKQIILDHCVEIYAFAGNIGVGKNYVSENAFAKQLSPRPTLVTALADHFKVNACTKGHFTYDRIFVTKDEESRRYLQLEGTERGRMVYGEDIWVETLFMWMQIYINRGIRRFIIPDVRFVNEVELIRDIGGKLIRVNAPRRSKDRAMTEAGGDIVKYEKIISHPSETTLNGYSDFDYFINNDYDDVLETQVSDMIAYFKLVCGK